MTTTPPAGSSQWETEGRASAPGDRPQGSEDQCVLVRRDTREKVFVSLDELETAIPPMRKDLYQRALENREKRTWAATTMDEVKELAKANTGYIKTMWCGDLDCELKMKEEAGLSSRCMPLRAGAAPERRVPLLRQARQDHGLLGHRLLKTG